MKTTWRERIAEAEARGRFTRADYLLACDCRTCGAGEALLAVGLEIYTAPRYYGVADLGDEPQGGRLHAAFSLAVWSNRVAEAARLLDLIEDRALELKRRQ